MYDFAKKGKLRNGIAKIGRVKRNKKVENRKGQNSG